MKLLKKEQAAPKGRRLSEEQETDARLGAALGVALISNPQMEEAIVKLVSSADPVMALGQYLGTTVLGLKQNADKNGLALDDSVWLAEGGVVDRMTDQLILNLSAKGMDDLRGQEDAIADETMNVLKMASQTGQQQQGPPQPQAGPPAPVAGPPVAPTPMGREVGGMY